MKIVGPGMDSFIRDVGAVKTSRKAKSLPHKILWSVYYLLLIGNDMLMTMVGFGLAYHVRFNLNIAIFQQDAIYSQPYYSSLTFVLVPVWLIIFASIGLYNRQYLLGGTDEYALVARATTAGLMVLIIFGFLKPEFIIARGWLFLAWFFSFLFVTSGRFTLRRVVYFGRTYGYFSAATVIVGANDEGISLARQLSSWKTSGLRLIGFVDKKLKPGTLVLGGLRVLGSTDDLDEIVEHYGVEEIVLASSAISTHDKLLDVFQQYGVDSDINVRMSSGLYEIITTGLTVKEFAYVPLVGVNKVRLTGTNQVIKFLLDYLLTIPGMIVLLPVLALIALAIRLDSPGPIVFRRRVMGVNGRQFDAFKFRTMYTNGDEILSRHPKLKSELETSYKIKNDPRVTRVGKWLRRFSLDELPQLINVLKGEMSLVGPRMISPQEMAVYRQWGMNLLTVKPGLTGLWQVSGRSDVSYAERVRLDMHYIRNYSPWLDFQIILRTIPVFIYGHGAY